jgi:hypothetical protein
MKVLLEGQKLLRDILMRMMCARAFLQKLPCQYVPQAAVVDRMSCAATAELMKWFPLQASILAMPKAEQNNNTPEELNQKSILAEEADVVVDRQVARCTP